MLSINFQYIHNYALYFASMQFATILLLGSLANASVLGVRSKRQSCYEDLCNIQGWETRTAIPFTENDDVEYYTEDACGKACARFDGCVTYALGRGTCRLYDMEMYAENGPWMTSLTID